jgi:hypothetical protein
MRGLYAYHSSAFEIAYDIFLGFELAFNDSTTETIFILRQSCFKCQATRLNKCHQHRKLSSCEQMNLTRSLLNLFLYELSLTQKILIKDN